MLIIVSSMQMGSIITVPVLIFCSWVSGAKIHQEQYLKRWGSLFEEFKNDRGLLSYQFYAIFCLRRLVYALSQIYLNSDLLLQAGLNIVFSLMQLMHLLI